MDWNPAELEAMKLRLAEANRLFAIKHGDKTLVEIANEMDEAAEENMREYYATHPDDPMLKF